METHSIIEGKQWPKLCPLVLYGISILLGHQRTKIKVDEANVEKTIHASMQCLRHFHFNVIAKILEFFIYEARSRSQWRCYKWGVVFSFILLHMVLWTAVLWTIIQLSDHIFSKWEMMLNRWPWFPGHSSIFIYGC